MALLKKPIKGVLLMAWAGIITLAQPAPDLYGEVLKMETRTRVEVNGDALKMRLTVKNNGNTTAYGLKVLIGFPWDDYCRDVCERLDPGRSEIINIVDKIRVIRKGTYPVRVRLTFEDANKYPFDALSGFILPWGKSEKSDCLLQAEDRQIESEGTICLCMTNRSRQKRRGMVRLFLPREIVADSEKKIVDLDKGENRDISFKIWNASALEGAQYPVFCFFEYDTEQFHHTVLSKAMINIREYGNPFRSARRLWLAVAFVLALWIFFESVRALAKRRG